MIKFDFIENVIRILLNNVILTKIIKKISFFEIFF